MRYSFPLMRESGREERLNYGEGKNDYEEGNSRDEERKNFFGEGKKEAAAFLERIDKPNAKYW